MHARLRLNSTSLYLGLPNVCGADSEPVGGGTTGISGAAPVIPQGTATDSASGSATNPEVKYENPESKIRALEEEKNRHWKTAQELQAENASLKQFKEEIERKGLSETEALKKDLGERDARIAQLEQVNKTMALKMAFLSDNTYQWVDMEAALKLIDLPSDVKVTDNGEVSDKRALQSAIKVLAEKSPYLIKQSEDQASGKPADSTGTPPAQKAGGTGETEQQVKERLAKQYPALRHHI